MRISQISSPIFFKLANAHYIKAYGEIGIILYREMQDFEKAQEWFVKAEKMGHYSGKAIMNMVCFIISTRETGDQVLSIYSRRLNMKGGEERREITENC